MLCRNPYVGGVAPVGCGQCLPCRINRRRQWTHRCILESYNHKASCFVTLTYSPPLLPFHGSLEPRHLRHFLKLLRREVSPTLFRFYSCGEYGEESQHPHYHLSLFGLGIEYGPLIQKIWSLGSTVTYELSEKTAQYVAGYVTKKMTSFSDPRLKGRFPEFARMSNRPGLGALSLQPLVEAIHTEHGLNYLEKLQDVPDHVMVGNKKVMLGRYLRQKLREEIGAPEWWQARAKQNGVNAANEQVLALQARHGLYPGVTSAKEAFLKENEGKLALMESFSKLAVVKGKL